MSVTQEQYDGLLDNLKWLHAITSILVEQEGGAVQISKELLASYDLRGELRIRDEDDRYTVEVVPFEGDANV